MKSKRCRGNKSALNESNGLGNQSKRPEAVACKLSTNPFTLSTVAEAVAKREHSIDGLPVDVKLYHAPKPRPNYPNKLKFSNVPIEISHERLASYLKSAAKLDVEGILYGDDSSVVVATFAGVPGKRQQFQQH